MEELLTSIDKHQNAAFALGLFLAFAITEITGSIRRICERKNKNHKD